MANSNPHVAECISFFNQTARYHGVRWDSENIVRQACFLNRHHDYRNRVYSRAIRHYAGIFGSRDNLNAIPETQ